MGPVISEPRERRLWSRCDPAGVDRPDPRQPVTGRPAPLGLVPLVGRYRPALDGLRTVAVATVMVFHFRPSWLPGGFVGVDIFFVLSGYLITGLIRDELVRTGSLDLGRFYARRVRRLLPAALITIATTAAATWWLGDDLERELVADDILPAAFAWSNWHFLERQTDYFAADNDLDPFSHFWSLAVEEQFYLVWPATIVGLWLLARRLTRRPAPSLALLVALGSVAGLAAWWASTDHAPVTAYYATWFRAAQLGAGAALAFAAPRRAELTRATAASATTAVGLAGIIAVTATIDTGDAYPGAWGPAVTLATVATVAGLEADPRSWAAAALSWRPIVYLGTISYGLYLWHIPVASFLPRIADRYDLGDLDRFPVLVAATLVLAAGSGWAIETPVRQNAGLSRLRPVVLVATALAVFAAGAGVATAALRPGGEIDGIGLTATELAAAAQDRPETYALGCHGGQETAWVGELCVRRAAPGRPVVSIVGDSHAGNWDAALLGVAEGLDVGYRYATYSACPAVDLEWNDESQASNCVRFRETIFAELSRRGPGDLVLVAFNWSVLVRDIDASSTAAERQQRVRDLAEALDRTMSTLHAGGATVGLLSPIPQLERGGPQCLADANQPTACDTEGSGTPSAEDELATQASAPALASGAMDAIVPIGDLVCPDGVCSALSGSVVTYRDREHLSQAYSASLSTGLAVVLGTDLGWPS